jgi:hypothetical protein
LTHASPPEGVRGLLRHDATGTFFVNSFSFLIFFLL